MAKVTVPDPAGKPAVLHDDKICIPASAGWGRDLQVAVLTAPDPEVEGGIIVLSIAVILDAAGTYIPQHGSRIIDAALTIIPEVEAFASGLAESPREYPMLYLSKLLPSSSRIAATKTQRRSPEYFATTANMSTTTTNAEQNVNAKGEHNPTDETVAANDASKIESGTDAGAAKEQPQQTGPGTQSAPLPFPWNAEAMGKEQAA
ncbi:hypothetical protein O1611_g7199 [Lasiodiplodia mahajangana]|uniref:Uncharacterized protein n=1 Tax=Lasiodiplodia mahajangana TaxID=1108764 RepID=A0ACC2JGD3_9PEZI|nr:hypothetical protein O1611_g7199 [Lasiodiplodia mahajangana]